MRNTLIPNQWIIEGVDRLGKTTLIKGLLNELGYHLVIHSDKPKVLKFYGEEQPLLSYQKDNHRLMFDLIQSNHALIFDRAHLSEVVYSPLYRKYSGDYVFALESLVNTSRTRLVLLTTSDFSFIQDDGQSFDFSKKEEEQKLFVEAFHKSGIRDKVLLDVADGNGGYRTPESILAQVLNPSKS